MLEELSLHSPAVVQAKLAPSIASLRGLNLDGELLESYQEAKNFLDSILTDSEIPPNQIAQVMNTVTAILKEIVKMQTEVHNAERVKKLELAMIHSLRETCSEETQNAFFAEFEKLCSKV